MSVDRGQLKAAIEARVLALTPLEERRKRRKRARPSTLTPHPEVIAFPPVKNCGTGSGGFQEGNTCARGGDGGDDEATASSLLEAWEGSDKTGVDYDRLRDPATAEGKQFGALLDRLPNHSGTVYRGSIMTLEEGDALTAGGTFTLPLHFSFSKDMEVAGEFLGENELTDESYSVLFIAKVKTGKDLTELLPTYGEDKQEVAVKAGTAFKVKEVDRSREGMLIITLTEAPRAKGKSLPGLDDLKNCGNGAGGFQPGNTCARGDGEGGKLDKEEETGGGSSARHAVKEWVDPPKPRGQLGTGKAGGYSSDKAAGTNTQLGREGEKLFSDLTGGKIIHPPGKGEQSPLDVVVDGIGYEVKAVSADATSFKATPKPHEMASKLAFAEELGVKAALAIVIIDRKEGKAYAYRRMGLAGGRLSSKTGWEHQGVVEMASSKSLRETVADLLKNCGTGGGGFQPGNSCARGGGGGRGGDLDTHEGVTFTRLAVVRGDSGWDRSVREEMQNARPRLPTRAEYQQLGRKLMDEHELHDWKFAYQPLPRGTLAQAVFIPSLGTRVIQVNFAKMSKEFTSPKEWVGTLYHEMAHAMVSGEKVAAHGQTWTAKFKEISGRYFLEGDTQSKDRNLKAQEETITCTLRDILGRDAEEETEEA